jgi:hypothetical protein
MSDLMFGRERSGTPLETRGGTQQLARMLQGLLGGSPAGARGLENMMEPFHRMGAQSFMNLWGLDPRELGIGEVARDVLAHPGDRTRGLFSAMEPFEERETQRQVAEMRDIFGTAGGRFGRNVAGAEGELRGELSGQFARSREQALLEAGGQRIQALLGLLGAGIQQQGASLAPLELLTRFFQPGPMVWQEGIAPDIIRGAGNVAASKWGMGPT